MPPGQSDSEEFSIWEQPGAVVHLDNTITGILDWCQLVQRWSSRSRGNSIIDKFDLRYHIQVTCHTTITHDIKNHFAEPRGTHFFPRRNCCFSSLTCQVPSFPRHQYSLFLAKFRLHSPPKKRASLGMYLYTFTEPLGHEFLELCILAKLSNNRT